MPELVVKEALYSEYCSKCKHKNTPETEEPCNSCLNQGWNEYSHKPIKFEEDK